MNTFHELGLIEPICRALSADNYTQPTPIQQAALPHLIDGGDILASAQTGTGKTASFALPILQHLEEARMRPAAKTVQALVLVPTRELAIQVATSFERYGRFTKVRAAAVYGGVGYGPQIRALRNGLNVLVATPGRLLDLLESGHVSLSRVQFLVLDEADRMLDMGFRRDLEKIVGELPEIRQTSLFSATISKDIEQLSTKFLENPKRINVSPVTVIADNIDERVMFVGRDNKNELLYRLLTDDDINRAIVFTRTKHVADRVSKILNRRNIRAEAIHGNKSQNQRQRSLTRFRGGQARVLVATDVAARGIDVDGISHVINYQLSNEAESYVHRIGRTARAGRRGIAVTMCDHEELDLLRDVERLLKRRLTVEEDFEHFDSSLAAQHAQASAPRSDRPGRSRPGSGRSRGRRGNFQRGGRRRQSGQRA